MPSQTHSPLDARPSTPHSNDEVLVRVEGVSKKFCRSLKKSLWYGVCDIAGELLPGRKRESQRTDSGLLRADGTTKGTNAHENLTTIERQGGRENEQPKVGPKGEEVASCSESYTARRGTTESNGSDGHNRESWQIRGRATEGWPEGRIETLGKVEKDCREAAPKEEQVGKTCESNERERTSQMKIEAGPCLDKPSGGAFSNPSASQLARDTENTSLTRCAGDPASASSGHSVILTNVGMANRGMQLKASGL